MQLGGLELSSHTIPELSPECVGLTLERFPDLRTTWLHHGATRWPREVTDRMLTEMTLAELAAYINDWLWQVHAYEGGCSRTSTTS